MTTPPPSPSRTSQDPVGEPTSAPPSAPETTPSTRTTAAHALARPRHAGVIEAAAALRPDANPAEGPRLRRATTTAHFLGYWYTRAWVSSRRISYRCSHYRQGCRGTMEFRVATMGYAAVRPHTCRDHEVRTEAVDVYVAMAGVIDSLALADLSVTPRSIWDSVRAQFYPESGSDVVRGLSEQQTIARVYRIRNRAYGGEIYGVIERPPMSNVRDTNMPFFMFHHVVANADPTQRPDRIIGWSHPVLFNLLRYNSVSLFIDGTFRCVPRFFAQCVVLMVHDRPSGLFVPACFVLTTNRTADTYWDVLHYIIQSTDQQLNPADIVCDFEAGLISAIETQLPNADIIGCLFHFKQANRRKMKKLQIPEAEIVVAMTPGVVDMLTVIDPEQIEQNGIRWVRKQIIRRCAALGIPHSSNKWNSFWAYFRRTWIERYNPAVWNVHGLDNHVVARTNNPLERFNREMNAAFPTPHPSMAVFVGTINSMAVRYAARLADIPRGRARRVPRETIALPAAVVFEGDTTSSDENSGGESAVPDDADGASAESDVDNDSDTLSVASMSFDYGGEDQDDEDDDEHEGEDHS